MLFSSPATFSASFPHAFSTHSKKPKLFSRLPSKRSTSSFLCLRIGVEDIAEIAQNKVLVAATAATAIGQLSKPFTSALFYGKMVDFKAVIRSGGMPSSHSAGTIAAATALGLERGFSDSVFGMSVIFAAFVMYDAQGVRREAGYHAKILNMMLQNTKERAISNQEEDEDLIDSEQQISSVNADSLSPPFSLAEESGYFKPNAKVLIHKAENVATRPIKMKMIDGVAVDKEQKLERSRSGYIPLNESVGHTEIEVIVGALWGFIVSLLVCTIL